jgi:hypothetical protein
MKGKASLSFLHVCVSLCLESWMYKKPLESNPVWWSSILQMLCMRSGCAPAVWTSSDSFAPCLHQSNLQNLLLQWCLTMCFCLPPIATMREITHSESHMRVISKSEIFGLWTSWSQFFINQAQQNSCTSSSTVFFATGGIRHHRIFCAHI